jgi:serine/threonine protein phosphatase PrpC
MKTVNRSDIGHTRTVNEDRAYVQSDINGFTLAIVADGMGGHQAGDTASQMAIDRIRELLQANLHLGLSADACELVIRQAVEQANRDIFNTASTKLEYQGMGTTVVLAVSTEETLIIANIGDSRAYKVTDGSIVQLTEDHSLVNELVKSGQISPEEAGSHPRRNVLTRALGTENTVNTDIYHVDWSDQDMVLLCSDGLSGMVEREQMIEILHKELDLDGKADLLVASALEAGGEDNITVVLLANEPEHGHQGKG